MYIERQLEKKFIAINKEYACVLLTGPRQVGKSTMLRHLMEGTARAEVSLDDLEERRLAKTDPAMFLKLHSAPVLIDEVQYAPELFSYIKIAVDNGAAPGSYWLTGSQAYRLMELAQESLAGRTAILHIRSEGRCSPQDPPQPQRGQEGRRPRRRGSSCRCAGYRSRGCSRQEGSSEETRCRQEARSCQETRGEEG